MQENVETLEGREWGIALTAEGLVIYILIEDGDGRPLYVFHAVTRAALLAAATSQHDSHTVH